MIIMSLQCFWTKLKIIHGRKVRRLGGQPQRLFMALVGDMLQYEFCARRNRKKIVMTAENPVVRK